MRKQLFLAVVLSGALFLARGEEAGIAVVPDSAQPAAAPAPAAAAPQEEGAMVLKPKIATYDYDAIPKDPLASALLSVSIPGTGQIYNKEYVHGILTAAAFYLSVWGIQALVDKWTQLNTDTVYLAETNKNGGLTGNMREVYIPKPDSLQAGLAPRDKALLVSAITVAAGSYIFGIIDSYMGAKRYNKKLLENQQIKFGLTADPVDKKIGVSANLKF